MKTTIKLISAAMLLTLCLSVNGQQAAKSTPEAKAKREAHGLKQQFSLTDAQAAKCEQIIKKYAAKFAETRQTAMKAAKDSTKNKNAKQQLLNQRDAEIKAVLTQEQSAKFDKWMQERKNPKGKAMQGNEKPKK